MPLLEQMQAGSANFDTAIMAATISILLGGILFGVGLGFGARRIRLLGAEEIGQGIISAAMLGVIISFAALLDASTASLVPSALPSCPGVVSPSSSPYSFYGCNLDSLGNSLSSLASSLARASEIAGFASSIRIDAGAVSAQPFFALQSASSQLSGAANIAALLSALSFSEQAVAEFIRASALAVFLPAGLILRTFFATRKVGAAAMAAAVAAYVFYPLFFLYSMPASPSPQALQQANAAASSFNSQFAAIPLLELDDTSSVKEMVQAMSEGDFGAAVQPLFPLSFQALFLSAADLLLFPLLSLAIAAVAALEMYKLLSAPIFLPCFEAI
jgi:hypothetical protein